ncbi:hypothetical protein GBA65_13360 [Rubrobacter marinus]|uniref:Sec-independent protein translocase protein TatA n=1 Tax=Rubrobacter marinus TaxID=2653852 RepID=A0A6G8PYL0_9ACTN|nr:twin-arginine translocase TatA/TatE family subunit [Rubrobacter marinus]QIN79334.1 hypothetical protein GBA65_13360 [Rubrobacter marinus]
MSIGPFEILLVLAVLALIIGPRRVTDMAKSFGRGVQEFVAEIGDKGSDSKREAIGDGDEKADEKDKEATKGTNKR